MDRYELRVDENVLNRFYVFDNEKETNLSLNDLIRLLNRLNEKMNRQAFDLYKHNIVSFAKAVELSNTDFKNFSEYCLDNDCHVGLLEWLK